MRRRAEVRQRMITVIVLGDRFAGAVAYALQSALHAPATIRVVRVERPRERDQDFGLPLPMITITSEAADTLVQQSAGRDMIVVESPGHHLVTTDAWLLEVRRHAPCLVVEVDDEGQVVRASGPDGWSYSASTRTRPEPATAGDIDRTLR